MRICRCSEGRISRHLQMIGQLLMALLLTASPPGCSAPRDLANQKRRAARDEPGKKVLGLDPDLQTVLGAAFTAVAEESIDVLARARVERVLFLPPSGAFYGTLPATDHTPLLWAQGSSEAFLANQQRIHRERRMHSVQRTIEAFYGAVGVPMVSREVPTVDAALAEQDLEAVFGNSTRAAQIGRLVAADAICMIKYDTFYRCYFEYEHGQLANVVNDWQCVLVYRCVSAKTGEVLFNTTVDTLDMRADPKAYAANRPYVYRRLGLHHPAYTLQLPEPIVFTAQLMLEKSWLLMQRFGRKELHDLEGAAALMARAEKALPSKCRLDWLCVQMDYARLTADPVLWEQCAREARVLLEEYSPWYGEAVRRTHRFADPVTDQESNDQE